MIRLYRLDHLFFKKSLVHYPAVFNKVFNFTLTYLSNYSNLKTKIEYYMAAGRLRYQYVKDAGLHTPQLKQSGNKEVKIGFLGTLGKEANFSKEFFQFVATKAQVYLYDLVREKKNQKYAGTDIFDNLLNITYRKTPQTLPWFKSTKGYKKLQDTINYDNLDCLLIITQNYNLPMIDGLTTPGIFSFNANSLLLSHPKVKGQTFVQPPWPYIVKNNRVYNLKSKTEINDCIVHPQTFMFSKRGVDHFKPVDISERKYQFFFSGNLRKLMSKEYCSIVVSLLKRYPDAHFVYYGKKDRVVDSYLGSLFGESGVLQRTHYKGQYNVKKDLNGNLVDDGNVFRAFKDIVNSRLIMNTFPISGARNIIEAYCAQVPVIHLDFSIEKWMSNQELQPFKLPMILTSEGTARSIESYSEKCGRVMNDEVYAKNIIAEQNVILHELTDPEKRWLKLNEMFDIPIRLMSGQQR